MRVLPPGWEQAVSRSRGVVYYVEIASGRTQWEFPGIGDGGDVEGVEKHEEADCVEAPPQACLEDVDNPYIQWLQKPSAPCWDQEHLQAQPGCSPDHIDLKVDIGHILGELQ